ncbi:MAG: STAS domain-containing protein [Chitinivibrionales bacterium]|nr:STAS domain-containing protein [Chitinivibrionales bacterium]MBD3394783.1 STAS domain-containing protein [Chitinivibrionales bacterium]
MEFKLSLTGSFGKIEMIGQFWEHGDFAAFEKAIEDCLGQGLTIAVVDLSRLTFVSSQGLGRLVRAYSKMREAGGELALLSPLGSVRETIEIAGFADFMNIYNSEAELAEALG